MERHEYIEDCIRVAYSGVQDIMLIESLGSVLGKEVCMVDLSVELSGVPLIDWYAYCYLNTVVWSSTHIAISRNSYGKYMYELIDAYLDIEYAYTVIRGDIESIVCVMGRDKLLCSVFNRVFLLEKGKFDKECSVPKVFYGIILKDNDYNYLISKKCYTEIDLAMNALHYKDEYLMSLLRRCTSFDLIWNDNNVYSDDELCILTIRVNIIDELEIESNYEELDYVYENGRLYVCGELYNVSSCSLSSISSVVKLKKYDNLIIIRHLSDYTIFLLDFMMMYKYYFVDVKRCSSKEKRVFLLNYQ